MKSRLHSRDKAWLASALDEALYFAFHHKTCSEPQLVANLVSMLPKYIDGVKFHGIQIKAGGVFVHARPFVTCSSFPEPSPQSVEVGDLLLIRTLVVGGNVEERRALLLQAKKADRIPATPDNQNQWHLYEQWPQFIYAARSGGLTGKTRHIKEPDMYDAAKYLLISTDFSARHWHHRHLEDRFYHRHYHRMDCFDHTAQPTKPQISRYRCFVIELVEFLAGNAGKVFVDPALATQGWDQFIHDLIDETAKAKTIFMGRATGASGKSARGSGVLFCALANEADSFLVAGRENNEANNFKEPPEIPSEWGEDGDGGGISIIEFVVEQGEG